MDVIKFDKNCLRKYKNWRVSTTRIEPSSGNYLHIDLDETMEYALTQTANLRGYTPIRSTRANWMSLDINSTSCTDLAKFDHCQACMQLVAC